MNECSPILEEGVLDVSYVEVHHRIEDVPLSWVEIFAHRFAKTKAFADCVSAFTIAIGLNGKEPRFYLHRGLCQHSLKEELEARKDYNRALAIDAKFQPAHYYLGMSYLGDKKNGKAMFHFKKAQKIDAKSKVGKKATAKIKKMRRR